MKQRRSGGKPLLPAWRIHRPLCHQLVRYKVRVINWPPTRGYCMRCILFRNVGNDD